MRALPGLKLLCTALALAAPVAVEAASAPSFAVQAFLQLDRQIGYGDFAWNEDGVAPGQMTVVVDLEAELVYVYRGGVEIGRSSMLYGADSKPTPTGVFPILEKDRDHVSNIYHAPMPYMLRLTWGGVSIHGTQVDDGYATHGCIGVPDEFAALLFARARVGDRVLVTRGWQSGAQIASAAD